MSQQQYFAVNVENQKSLLISMYVGICLYTYTNNIQPLVINFLINFLGVVKLAHNATNVVPIISSIWPYSDTV